MLPAVSLWIRKDARPKKRQAQQSVLDTPSVDGTVEDRKPTPGLGNVHPAVARNLELRPLPRSVSMRWPLETPELNTAGCGAAANTRRKVDTKYTAVFMPVDVNLHIDAASAGIQRVAKHR